MQSSLFLHFVQDRVVSSSGNTLALLIIIASSLAGWQENRPWRRLRCITDIILGLIDPSWAVAVHEARHSRRWNFYSLAAPPSARSSSLIVHLFAGNSR